MLGDVTESLGLHEQSQSAFRQAMIRIEAILKRRPDHADAVAMGAAALAFLGEADQAEKWAERSISLEPHNYGVRYNSACAYAVIGKPAEAIDNLEFIYSNIPRVRPWLLGMVQHDSSWKPYLTHPRYQALIKHLEEQASASSQ